MKRKIILLAAIFCAAFSTVFAAPLEQLLDSGIVAGLKNGGEPITETQLKKPVLKLLPAHADLRKFVNDAKNTLEPEITVETLALYKKPVSSLTNNYSGIWTEKQRVELFNRILALSTLTGIEYYSASRKAMRVFYESSVVIDDPASKKPLADPVFPEPPSTMFRIYARQKDLTFGDNIYRYDFLAAADAFFFIQENITALTAGIIPAVGKNKLRSVFAVIDCGDSLLIYAVSMAKAASIPGMGDRIGNSFANRAQAVIKWFSDKANTVFFAD